MQMEWQIGRQAGRQIGMERETEIETEKYSTESIIDKSKCTHSLRLELQGCSLLRSATTRTRF